jgi:hypothetical protein
MNKLESKIVGMETEREILHKRISRLELAIDSLQIRILVYDDDQKVAIIHPLKIWQEILEVRDHW